MTIDWSEKRESDFVVLLDTVTFEKIPNSLRFIKDFHKINVALSRAQRERFDHHWRSRYEWIRLKDLRFGQILKYHVCFYVFHASQWRSIHRKDESLILISLLLILLHQKLLGVLLIKTAELNFIIILTIARKSARWRTPGPTSGGSRPPWERPRLFNDNKGRRSSKGRVCWGRNMTVRKRKKITK